MPEIRSHPSFFADHSLVPASSFLYQFKVKLFCGLHAPAGFYTFYHYSLLMLIFGNSFVINLLLDLKIDDYKRQQLVNGMTFIDTTLLTIFTIEWALRLFVADVSATHTCLTGIARYFATHKSGRLFDGFSVAILSVFVAVSRRLNGMQPSSMRILHFLLLFQFYRVFGRTFVHFATVVRENAKLIIMSLSIYMVVLSVATYIIYFCEVYDNDQLNTLYDSAWFSFVSLATIGYGDIMIVNAVTKVITSVLVMCGFCVFTLPGAIVGSAVAMRLQEHREKILCLRPAANLLQKTWRFYAILHIDHFWLRHIIRRNQTSSPRSPASKRTLSRVDEYAILFICKVSFLLAQSRFKYAIITHSTGSVPLQYVQLQRKIDLVDNAIRKHKYDINTVYLNLKNIATNLKECNRRVREVRQKIAKEAAEEFRKFEPKTDKFTVTGKGNTSSARFSVTSRASSSLIAK